jgi:GntR family transcriptional regulator
VTADATVASRLALTRGERVVRIRRVRLADGIPLSFDEIMMASVRFAEKHAE